MPDLSDVLRAHYDDLAARSVDRIDVDEVVGSVARRSTQRLAVAVASVAVVVSATGFLVSRAGDGADREANQLAAAPVFDRSPRPFVPPRTTAGAVTQVTIRLLDGRSFVLSYPSELAVAEEGLSLTSGFAWERSGSTSPHPCCGRTFVTSYGGLPPEVAALPVSAVYRDADGGRVELRDGGSGRLSYLVFAFGDWVALVYDYPEDASFDAEPMSDAERASLSSLVRGAIDEDGFVQLSTSGQIEMGATEQPEASFGDLVSLRVLQDPRPTFDRVDARGYGLVTHSSGSVSLYPPHTDVELILTAELAQFAEVIDIWTA